MYNLYNTSFFWFVEPKHHLTYTLLFLSSFCFTTPILGPVDYPREPTIMTIVKVLSL